MHQSKDEVGKEGDTDPGPAVTPDHQHFERLQQEGICPQSEEIEIPVDRTRVETVSESASEEICSNNYNCTCISCQNKYGGLPLLLQVIEQQSLLENTDQQPSTSSLQITSTSTSTKVVSKKCFKCGDCNKCFSHKGDFNKHLRKHTKEQPFSCPVCKRKFAHTSNLQRHCRLHSGHKPFICDNCDKRFSRKDKLECHKKSKFCQEARN